MTLRIGDIIITVLAVLIISFYIITTINIRHNNNQVYIDFNGVEYLYPIEQDRDVTLENSGEFISFSIVDRSVYVTEASCQNKLCIKMGSISHGGESIACLPNRCLITLKGEDNSEVDVVSW